jgi:hypothetical protein
VDEYFIDAVTKLATTNDSPDKVAADFDSQVKALYK